jgi:phage gpG-like protein
MPAKSIFSRNAAVLAYISMESDLDNIASGVADEVDEVMREKVEEAAEAAKGTLSGYTMPYGSGDLAGSIKVVKADLAARRGYRVVADDMTQGGRYQVPTGVLVEYGFTHRFGKSVAPRPFLTSALDERRDEIEKAVKDKVEELIKE